MLTPSLTGIDITLPEEVVGELEVVCGEDVDFEGITFEVEDVEGVEADAPPT